MNMKKQILIISIVMFFISGCSSYISRVDPRYLTDVWRTAYGYPFPNCILRSRPYSTPALIECGGNISHGWKIFETETIYPTYYEDYTDGRHKLFEIETAYHSTFDGISLKHHKFPFVKPTFLMRVDEGVKWWLIKAGNCYYLLDHEKGGRIKRIYEKAKLSNEKDIYTVSKMTTHGRVQSHKKEKLPDIDALGITGKIKIGKLEAQYVDIDTATDLFSLDGIICSNNQWGFLINKVAYVNENDEFLHLFWIRYLTSEYYGVDFFPESAKAKQILIRESENSNEILKFIRDNDLYSISEDFQLGAKEVGKAKKNLIGESKDINDLVKIIQNRKPDALIKEPSPWKYARHPEI